MKFDIRRIIPFIEALFVVSLWSATPPLAKIVMEHMPTLQFLGVRYTIAFLALIPICGLYSSKYLKRMRWVSWLKLVLIGVLAYPIANGLQFWALTRLNATTGTFTMNFVPIFTVCLGIIWLAEYPIKWQWLGIILVLLGSLVFFLSDIELDDYWAVGASIFGSLLLAITAILARSLIRMREIDSVALAAIPLGIGGVILLCFTPPTEIPPLEIVSIVIFLSVFSGAFAYLLWYHAMKSLQAFELTVIGNMMPMGTAIIAPLLLGEVVTTGSWAGLWLALLGIILVSLKNNLENSHQTASKEQMVVMAQPGDETNSG